MLSWTGFTGGSRATTAAAIPSSRRFRSRAWGRGAVTASATSGPQVGVDPGLIGRGLIRGRNDRGAARPASPELDRPTTDTGAVGHLRSLTSVRFLAAFMVLGDHAFRYRYGPLFGLGYTGVTLFFILSGFILTVNRSLANGIRPYARNRAARILPLHYLTLLLALAVLPVGTGVDTAGAFLQNVLLIQAWSPEANAAFNLVTWSISAEFFFYVALPLLTGCMRRLGRTALLATVVGVWTVYVVVTGLLREDTVGSLAGFYTYIFPPVRLSEFVIGVALGFLFLRGWRPSAALRRLAVLGTSGLVLSTLIAANRFTVGKHAAVWVAVPVFAALIYLLAVRDVSGGTGWLTCGWLVRLGRWSYAIYMIHWLVLVLAARMAHQTVGSFDLVPGSVASLLAIALAGLLYEKFERPLEKRLRAAAAPAPRT